MICLDCIFDSNIVQIYDLISIINETNVLKVYLRYCGMYQLLMIHFINFILLYLSNPDRFIYIDPI